MFFELAGARVTCALFKSCGANLLTVAENPYIVVIEALDSSFRYMMPTISAGYIVQAQLETIPSSPASEHLI
jgi:hypothetical protein